MSTTIARPVRRSARVARPVVKSEAPVPRIVTNFTVTAESSKPYPHHVVYCRPAPELSPYAGKVFVEIHCNQRHLASQPLVENNLRYQEFETVYCGKGKNFKILRFIASRETVVRLEQLCSITDDPARLAVHNEIMQNWSKYFGYKADYSNSKF